MSSDIDDTDEESDASVSTNVHPKAKKQSSDNTLKYAKKSAHNEGNVEDAMFKNLFSGDLRLKVAEKCQQIIQIKLDWVFYHRAFLQQ